jgi:hypothetical protein
LLIEIKAAGRTFRNAGIDEPDGVRTMPTEIIVIAIVISVFWIFAAALCWGDVQTRSLGKEGERSLRQ